MKTHVIDKTSITSLEVQKFTEPLHQYTSDWDLLEPQFQDHVFLLSGYDDDPRELHEIREVVWFMDAFDKELPFWLYFANLKEPGTNAWMIQCLCSTGMTDYDSGNAVVMLEKKRYENFMRWQLQYINDIMRRSGAPEELIGERLMDVAESVRSLVTLPV